MTRGFVICLLALLPACAVKGKASVVTAPNPDPREGRTSVRILDSPDARRLTEQSRVTVVPAEAGPENTLPVYPAAALRAGCGSGVVPVRIHIGTNGRVIRQGEVPGQALASDSCHQQFAEAVRAAVSEWGFFPAIHRACESDGAECTDTPITIYLDLEFQFDVVNDMGLVTTP